MKNKIYIIGSIIAVVLILTTYLITKKAVSGNKDKEIEKLEKDNAYAKEYIKQLDRDLDESEGVREKIRLKYDSLEEIAIKKDQYNNILVKELKAIKGKYKNFSNDSLYKELIKEYNRSSDSN